MTRERSGGQIAFETGAGFQGMESALPTTSELITRGLTRLGEVEPYRMQERNRFVRRFDWIPYWQAEATLALRGLPVQLRIIDKAPEPFAAAKGMYLDVVRYGHEARWTLSALDAALRDKEEAVPDSELIRANFGVREAIARFSLAHYCLDAYRWHLRNWNIQERKANRRNEAILVATTQALTEVADERLIYDYFLTRASSNQRLNFWATQYKSVKNDPRVKEVQAQIEPERAA